MLMPISACTLISHPPLISHLAAQHEAADGAAAAGAARSAAHAAHVLGRIPFCGVGGRGRTNQWRHCMALDANDICHSI